MVVAPGTRLGPYEVVAPLGAGGMGEVYRARDTRLGRDVAIKVLASEVANDPERRARFEREARAVAALDHAHICGIYDVGEANGIHYLVMPLLEGQTLEARLAKGPLPLDQALAIARQIADALDEAHRQGIVHRDLKPANVILTKVGTGSGGTPQAKLLDFGLAKLRAPGSPVTLSATGTAATAATGTAEGTILGTLHYMAPEQVEGKDADARSDIWALGAVLYEMVSGVRPFEGDTAASLIGAILKDRPLALASRDPLTPAALDDLVAGCLEKSPDDRWQHIGDIRRLLQVVTRTSVDAAPPARRPYGFALGLGAAFVSAIVIVAALLIRGPATDTPSAVSEPVTFTVTPPPGLQFVGSPGSVPIPQFAVSPDGRQLVYVASGLRGRASLWLRTLTEAEAKPLIGTDDAESPFWAPDSRTIGFAAQGALKRKDISSAAPAEVITSTPADGRGAAWSDDGRIVIAPTGTSGMRLITLTPSSATPIVLSPPTPASGSDASGFSAFDSARWPFFLPGGAELLFMVRHKDPATQGIYVVGRDGGRAERVIAGDFGAQYSSGFLLSLSGSALLAHPFDLRTRRTTGPAATVVEPVAGSSTGRGAFSAAQSRVLAYATGLLAPTELWKVDRRGSRVARLASAADYVDIALSPDGKHLAFGRTTEPWLPPDMWMLDLQRGGEARLTTDPLTESMPTWSPRGDQLIFSANRTTTSLALWQMEPSPGAVPQPIFSAEQQVKAHGSSAANILVTDWTPDGRFVLYHRPDVDGGFDISAVPVDTDGPVVPVTRSRYNEFQAKVSPDSRFVAFTSDESGRLEVYVQSFPTPTVFPRVVASVGGGLQPRWSANGRELYYVRSDGQLMAVRLAYAGSGLSIGESVPLFQTSIATTMNQYRTDYTVVPDGSGFIMKLPAEGARPAAINVLLNWTSLLKH